MNKHRDWEIEIMRAELLLDGAIQHTIHKHPDSCILPRLKEIIGCIISARNNLRNQFGIKQWTLTTGAYCTWGKRLKQWTMRPAKVVWSCETT